MKKLLPKTLKNPQGFTLVELLVVVSILAILAIIGFTVFSGLQKGARDAKRKADIESISRALEANYVETTAMYPVLTGAMFASGTIPAAPSGAAYTGFPTGAVATYRVCAALETTVGSYCLNNQR